MFKLRINLNQFSKDNTRYKSKSLNSLGEQDDLKLITIRIAKLSAVTYAYSWRNVEVIKNAYKTCNS